MLKKRVGIWAIFLIACLLCNLLVSVVPSIVIGIKQWSLEQELNSIIKENEEAAAKPPIEETNPDDEIEANPEKEAATQMLSTMVEIISNVARYIGIVVMVFGIFNFVLAFRDENSEGLARGVSTLVVGGVLMGFSVIVPMILGGMSG
jgi:predicted PurR-regulated permease PerM